MKRWLRARFSSATDVRTQPDTPVTAGRVFMDVASIGVGTRWAEVMEETLRSCEVAIILIGKQGDTRHQA